MAKTTTMAFSIDTSGFSKGLKEASNSLKIAKATFEANTAGMTGWSKSADGVREKLKLLASQQEAYSKKTELLKNQISSINSAYEENGKKADQLRAKKASLEQAGDTESKAYQQVCKELKSTESQMQSQQRTIEKHEQSLQMEELALTRVSNESTKWKGELVKLENAEKNATSSTEELSKSTENAGNAITTRFQEIGDSALSHITGAVVNAFSAGVSAMKDFVTQAIETGKTFNQSMSNVEAISGASAEDMEKLEKKARDLAAQTTFTSTQTADALGYMAMAGWETTDMLHGLDGVVYLASASGEELAKTSDILTDGLTAFGLSAKDSSHMADVMAAASSNANTNVELLGESFKYCASLAGSAGYTIEDASLALGLMANSGIKGSQAGTALRGALGNLAKPSTEVANAMADLGISLTDSQGDMYTLSELLQIIRKKFSGLSEDQRMYYATTIFGKNAMAGMLSIVNASDADFKKLEKAINSCDGAAMKMSKTMTDNLAGDTAIADSTLEELKLTLSDKVSPVLREVVQTGTEKVAELTDWVKSLTDQDWQKLVAGLEAVGIALAGLAVGLIIGKITTMITTFTTVIQAAGGAMAVFNGILATNPIGLVVTAIATAIAAFKYFYDTNSEFANFVNNLFSTIQQKLVEFLAFLQPFFDWLMQNLQVFIGYLPTFWEQIKGIIQGFIEFLAPVWDMLMSAFTTIKDTLTQWFEELKNIISGFSKHPMETIGKLIGWILGKVSSFHTTIISKIIEIGAGLLQAIGDWIGQIPAKIGEILTTAYIKVRDWATKLLTTGENAGKSLSQALWDTLKSLPGKMWKIGTDIVMGIWKGIGSMIGWIGDKIAGFAGGMLDGFKSALGIHSPSKAFEMQARFIPEGIAEGIKKASGEAYDALNDLSAGMVNTFNPNLEISANNRSGQGLGGYTIYNQTINAPKQLDLREIHRQSKNLLAFSKM